MIHRPKDRTNQNNLASDFLNQLTKFKDYAPKETVKHAFISIGTNLFIDFGPSQKEVQSSGKEIEKTDAFIWLEWTSWRLSQKGNYITGSDDPIKDGNKRVKCLEQEQILFFEVTSQFMDLKIHFSSDFFLETFFEVPLKEQWHICLPKNEWLSLEFLEKKDFSDVLEISKHFEIKKGSEELHIPLNSNIVDDVSYLDENILELFFDEKYSILFQNSWRLEREGKFCCSDGEDFEDKKKIKEKIEKELQALISLKLICINKLNEMNDTLFEFEKGYSIRTFSSYGELPLWTLLDPKDKEVYQLRITS